MGRIVVIPVGLGMRSREGYSAWPLCNQSFTEG